SPPPAGSGRTWGVGVSCAGRAPAAPGGQSPAAAAVPPAAAAATVAPAAARKARRDVRRPDCGADPFMITPSRRGGPPVFHVPAVVSRVGGGPALRWRPGRARPGGGRGGPCR